MMRLKSQHKTNGFMIVEVMIAIVVMSVSVLTLLNLQSNIINNVWTQNGYSERILKLKNLFYDPKNQKFFGQNYREERALEKKDIPYFNQLKYEVVPVKKGSEIYGRFPNMYLVKATGDWIGSGQSFTETLVGFKYISPPEEEE